MALPSQDSELPLGQQKPASTWGDFNNFSFMVQQALGKMQTATLVKIVSCTNSGGLSDVGYVDVIPMVNQLDGAGNPTPHVTIFNVPYLRVQGGANAVIIDPEPGDIGVAVFASRDLTKVKNTRANGNPGSKRQYSFSDALYLGGMLNGAPTQYVQFNTSGITIHSPTQVKLEAPTVLIEAGELCQIDAPEVLINATDLCSITADRFQIHAGTSWSWDVAGFGEQWKHTGGVTWEHRTWQTGAFVTNVNGPINPPDGTPT